MKLLLPEVEEFLRDKDFDSLKGMLSELDPVDIAELIELLPNHSKVVLFNLLELKTICEVFENLEVQPQIELLKHLPKTLSIQILNKMAPDERADLFKQLSKKDANRFLLAMEADESKDVEELISYPPQTAGGIMTTEFAWIPHSTVTEGAIDFLRQAKLDFNFHQIYVLNEKKQPMGVVLAKDLITSPHGTSVKKIMDKIPSVTLDTDQEKVAHIIARYDLISVPVVDKGKRMCGIVTVDDAIDVMKDEVTEDTYKFGAVGIPPTDYLSARAINVAKSRIVWLVALLFASFISGFVIEKFSYVLKTMVTLAIFIPLLLGCGGNAGIQAAAVVIRGLATGEIELSSIWKVVRKEFLIGILVGIGLGVLTAIRALIVQRTPVLGLVVGLSMMAGVCVATTIGGVLPIIFKKLGFDPALMSSPLITTIMDSVSLLIYFSVAIRMMQITQ